MKNQKSRPKVLAIASGGGHWVQMGRLRPALEKADLYFATISKSYQEDVKGMPLYVFRDANRWNKLAGLLMALQVLLIVIRVRPDYVISTGAAPGYFAIRFGKLFGAKTIWVDSIANVSRLSMSGGLVKPYADLWLTQWPELVEEGGPEFSGNVLGEIGTVVVNG